MPLPPLWAALALSALAAEGFAADAWAAGGGANASRLAGHVRDELCHVSLIQHRAAWLFNRRASPIGRFRRQLGPPTGKRSELPHWDRVAATGIAVAAPFLLVVAFIYARSSMRMVGARGEDKEGHATRQYGSIELVFFGMMFLTSLSTSIVIPESKNLAKSLGRGPLYSGLLIGAPWTLSALSNLWLLRPPTAYGRIRTIQLACSLGFGLAALLSAFGANPPGAFRLQPDARATLIMASRLAMGVFTVGLTFLSLLTQKILPDGHATTYQLLKMLSNTVGTSTGPYFSTLIGDLAGAKRSDERLGLALWTLALAWLLYCGIQCFALPAELDALLAKRLAKQTCESSEGAPARASETLPLPQRVVWVAGGVVGVLCWILVVAPQAALPTIWQDEFGLDTSDHGVLISAALASVTVFMLLLMKVRQVGQMPYASMLTGLVAILLTGCFLLLFGKTIWATYWSGALVVSAASAVIAVGDALAVQHSVPGTWYSQEYYQLFWIIPRLAVGSTVAPPAARLFLAAGGQRAFAQCQLVLGGLTMIGALTMQAVARCVPQQHSPRLQRRREPRQEEVGEEDV